LANPRKAAPRFNVLLEVDVLPFEAANLGGVPLIETMRPKPGIRAAANENTAPRSKAHGAVRDTTS
jgi:hypothetical protein